MTATKILILDTGKEWGGGTNSMIELLKRIDRTRFAITACFYNDYAKGSGSSLSLELAALDIPLVLLPRLKQPRWAKLAKELLRGLLAWHPRWRKAAVFLIDFRWRIVPRSRQIEALLREGGQCMLYVNNQPSSNLEGYLAAESAGVPLVQHCRIEAKLTAVEIATVNRVASRVICVSHGVAESLEAQGVASKKLSVVCNAIDGSQALPEPECVPDLPVDALVVGTVGTLVKRKSVDQLLRAVAALHDVRVHILILGTGPEREALGRLATQLGIDPCVHFVGFQKQPLPWVAAMNIVVLSSSHEGLPRAVLEAMLMSRPVVASRVVGSKELVVDGVTGYLYSYGDEAALASCIKRLLDDPDLRQKMGSAGRQRVLQNYSIDAYVTSVQALWGSALEGMLS